MSDRSLGSMRALWWAHAAFLPLYALVAAHEASAARSGHPFFTGPAFPLLFAAPAAAGSLLLWPALAGRARASVALLWRWILAELPALVGLIGFLSGAPAAWVGAGLGASALLLLAAWPRVGPARPPPG